MIHNFVASRGSPRSYDERDTLQRRNVEDKGPAIASETAPM